MGTPLANELLGHTAATPSSPGHLTPEEAVRRNIATLDILPENKQSSCVPALHVSEINGNAENGTGVNRVIADPTRLWELSRQKAGSCGSGVVPRVGRPPFKRRRAPLRRGTLYWSMLHRSRPDLIKGIGTRTTEAPSTSSQGLAEALSQSTSDVSIHSSGSAEFRPRLQPAASLSRTSSVGDASGSSTPTQRSRPSVRKKENKRAEIVASVTSRLYAIKKKPDPRQEALLAAEKEDEEDDELEELKLCKRARMKLFDLSRKLAMAKKVKRTVDSDTQTELQNRTLRVKEKSVATEQQGVLQVQNSSTNTPSDPNFVEPDSPLVMNQVFLQGAGNFVLECGPNLRVEVPRPHQINSGSQTIPECRDQTTSPKKSSRETGPSDEFYSDDSLESESSVNLYSNLGRKNLATKFYSCQELNSRIVPLYDTQEKQFFSQPNISTQNRYPSLYDKCTSSKPPDLKIPKKLPGVRVEKSLEPISRYNICGTNAIYEYDPNKSVPEKVIFSNLGETPVYGLGVTPPIVYPHYQPQLFNGLPMGSSDGLTSSDDAINNSKSQLNESPEDNLSSGTSSASTGSSIGASDTSSDDFVFMESSVPPGLQTRELYTISENSEPSCSNRSSPLNFRSPRLDTIDEVKTRNYVDGHEKNGETETKTCETEVKQDSVVKEQKTNDPVATNDKSLPTEQAVSKKSRVNWAEMECSGNKQFLNFNYTPSPLSGIKRKDKSTEALYPSEDSITFVFIGAKQKETSVLMEVVKRSLLGGSDPADLNSETRSRSRGVQCSSGKLMRSVSVDTAMIALSRLARNQRPFADMSRTASMSNVASEQVQVDLPLTSSESGTQCNITEKVDASSEIRPSDSGCQCDLDKSVTYSLGTSTTTDQETETDAEQKESTTQTEMEELFGGLSVELPRRTISPMPGSPDGASQSTQYSSRFSTERWKEMKQLVLGTGRDLFPNYLLSDDTEPKTPRNTKMPRKTVSWSDISVKDENSIKNQTSTSQSEDSQTSESSQPMRNVRFSEPCDEQPTRASTLPRSRVPTTETITEFLREATTLLQNLHHNDIPRSSECEVTESKIPQKRKYSTSYLLRRRRKLLAQIKINRSSPPKILNESSVQTDTETINRFVQTGGLASSLVGPPVRRSLTPNLRRERIDEGDTMNSTWPRKKISAKPPTGLKPNSSPRCSTPARSGSASSRFSTGSTTWTEASPLHSTENSPVHRRSPARAATYSSDQNMNLQIEQSCRRLEIAIEQDRVRQRNLVDCLELYFNDPASSHVLPTRNRSESPVIHKVNNFNRPSIQAFQDPPRNEIRQTERDHSRGNNAYHYNFTSPEPSKIWNNIESERLRFNTTPPYSSPRHDYTKRNGVLSESWKKNAPENIGTNSRYPAEAWKQQNSFRSYSPDWDNREETKYPEDFYNNYVTGGHQKFLTPTLPQNISSRPTSPREMSKKTCRCFCHNFNLSCGDMTTAPGDRRCHTCCVPCSSDPQRPYSSEPLLTPSTCDCHPTNRARGSPLAHLRHLIALRRTIVAAEKVSN